MPASDPTALPRLARVEAIHVRVPFRRPLLDATGEFTHRRSWLLRVVDEEGHEGLGEAALNPIAADVTTGALARLIREIVPALAAGRPPAWSELAAEGEPGRAAMAAVDGAIAALLAAQGAGTPARTGTTAPARTGTTAPAATAVTGTTAPAAGTTAVTGTTAPAATAVTGATAPLAAPGGITIPVSATIAFGGPDAGADAGAQAVELGFDTLKLRAGFERITDQLVDRLRALRAAVGPEPRLRIDAGGAWDLETAVERIEAIEPFRIEYVEQPLAAWDVAGHAALRGRVRVPIALDESIESEGSARAALAEAAADVLIVKPARVGGLAATVRIVDAASAAGASVILGTYSETGVGIAAVLRIAAMLRDGRAVEGPLTLEPAHGLATAGLLVHDLLGVPLPIEKGRMAVPAAVALDESEVDRYTLERFEARG